MPVTCLVVDDSPSARKVIVHYLRKAGCAVVAEASNALEALDLFRQHQPDVVTLDLMMPQHFNIDSMGLLRAIKRERPQTAVIVVSVIPFEKIRYEYIEQGVLAYIVKPLTEESFEPVRIKLTQLHPELALVQQR